MPLRFYRRFRKGPFRLNLSKRGVSYSVGGRGAWATFARGRTRTTVGLPGRGIYWTSYGPRTVTRLRPAPAPLTQLPTSAPTWLLILRVLAFAAILAVIAWAIVLTLYGHAA
jgi:hypothetical protein